MTPERSILSNVRLPARIDVEQTAFLLGFKKHDIQPLVRARLLEPLGSPAPNSVKYFSSAEILFLAEDRSWLDKATRAIAQHWQRRPNHVLNEIAD
jgi:hypothetical protein